MYIYGNDKAILNEIKFNKANFLTLLYVPNLKIKSLDISEIPALYHLDVSNNQLTTIDLSSCSNLTSLGCNNNNLTQLDLSLCSKLTELNCTGNQLTTVDLSSCSNLTFLWCYNNNLTQLDLSSCSKLKHVDCSGNQLTTVDLSSCTKLEVLYCYDNMLTSLKLAPNTPTEDIELSYNQSAFSLLNPYVYELIMKQANSDELGFVYKISEEVSPEYCLFDLRRELTAEPYGTSTKVDFFNVSEVIEGETGVFRFKPISGWDVRVEFSNPQFPNLVFYGNYDAELANGIEETIAPPKWKLSINDGVLNVSGLGGKTVAELYTVDGMFVDRVSTTDETVSVSVPNKGTVYLLRVTNGKNKHTYKITVP